MMLSKCCIQYVSKFGKPSSGHRTGKNQSSSQFPRSTVLKNVQASRQLHSPPMSVGYVHNPAARFQHYMNQELPDVQARFRKSRQTRDQIVNFGWIIEKEREFQKKIYHCVIDYTKAFGCVGHNKFWETLKEMEIPILPREGILGRKIGKTILPIS